MAVRRVGLSLWFNGKGPHMLKNKKFSICWQSWVVLWPHSYRTQPKGGLRTRLWARLLLLWQLAVMLGKWNLKSCCWPYKNMVEVLCELHGCWPMVVSLYVVEFCCLKASIPVESVTSTTLTASDTFTNEFSLRALCLILDLLNFWSDQEAYASDLLTCQGSLLELYAYSIGTMTQKYRLTELIILQLKHSLVNSV